MLTDPREIQKVKLNKFYRETCNQLKNNSKQIIPMACDNQEILFTEQQVYYYELGEIKQDA